MKIAWTTVFSLGQVPLIYYGDEVALPGYTDPDNRQPLWWMTGDVEGTTPTVEELSFRLLAESSSVLLHVQALSTARREHPALRAAAQTEWWLDDNVWAFAKSAGDDHALVVINRGAENRLANGLSFAGLPTGGAWRDVLSGDLLYADGDSLVVPMGPVSSRVLVPE
jgi:glycosidase